MSESKEYLTRVTELESGLFIIRDLSEPVKAFQQKVSVPACHVPLSCDHSSPIPAIIRLLIKKEKQARRQKNALQKKAERWEAVARQLAAFCAEMDADLAIQRGYDYDDANSPDQWLEAAQERTEPKTEKGSNNE